MSRKLVKWTITSFTFRWTLAGRPTGLGLDDPHVVQAIGQLHLVEGDGGVIHKLRGRPSNRRVEQAVRSEALRLYRQRYAGFGPTLAMQKLADEHELERFRREARAMARLDHPHIVPIYDHGVWQGMPYFTMKYMAGGSLHQHLGQYQASPTASCGSSAGIPTARNSTSSAPTRRAR